MTKIGGFPKQQPVKPADKATMIAKTIVYKNLLNQKFDAVDPRRTKESFDCNGIRMRNYYDHKGNSLYYVTSDGAGTHYHFDVKHPSTSSVDRVCFTDQDSDLAMDRMDVINSMGGSFQAKSTRDNGVFDIGMPCTGPQIAQEIKLK